MELLVDGPLRSVISNWSLTHALSAWAALARNSAASSGAAMIVLVSFMRQL
jgi:hypothetical protein